ncbi:MAG: rod shape-determining protein MreC [Lachnospiraceae bacterium]|nr:rod shape-determining protein MreC [Lachnospiraceae bacterium]
METKRSRYILLGLTLLCVFLIGVSSLREGIMDPLRTGVGYLLVPIQSGVNAVGAGIYKDLTDYGKLKTALSEKEELERRVGELIEENNRLQAGQQELNRLRELYQLDQEYMQYETIGARVIAKDSGDWFQVFRINKGSEDGVQVDSNVIAGGGLIGIVTDVGANYATVRSIIDDLSRVSAMGLRTGDKCIVAGDLTLYRDGRLSITNITKDGDIQDGDQIVTSNISSKFLPGILIGYAADVTIDSERLTKSGYLIPAADFDDLQEVLVIMETKETGDSQLGALERSGN